MTPLTFTHYSMTNGLLSNEIRSVVQDRTGYIWIASNNGLQRYDGVNYKTFQHDDNDPQSLPQNLLTQLLIDDDDNLWVLTYTGQVGVFDKSKFTFTEVPVKVKYQLSFWAAKSLIKDEYGNLFYMMHGDELLRFDKKKKEFSPVANFIPAPPNDKFFDLVQEPGTQKYWIASKKSGVAIYNRQTGHLSYTGHNIDHEKAVDSLAKFDRISHFMFDKKGRVWMVSWQMDGAFPKAIRFDPNGKQQVHTYDFSQALKTYHEIHGFLQQRDGSIWVRGAIILGKFNEDKNRFDLIPSDAKSGMGVVYEQVTGLFEDREKNVWICTGNNGLYRCNPSQQYFSNVFHLNPTKQQLGKGSIMSFMELKNGDILVGTWGDGMFRYNQQLQEQPLNINDPVRHGMAAVWNMCASADSNTIWMASQPGINQYDQAKATITFRNPAALQNRTIRQVAEDRQGNLWLGMHYFGLFKWVSPKNMKKDSLIQLPQVGKELVTQVVADNKGFIWVTTEKKGVFAFESETGQIRFHWNNRKEEDSLKIMEGFTGVLPFNDSLVYIATASHLYRFNRTTNVLVQQPLPGSLLGGIQALEKDKDGFLWIGTENGLYRYYPAKGTLVFFNREDGIANDRFIPAAAYRLKDGRMLFGGDNSFIYFTPSAVKLSNNDQKVILTSIQAGKKELPVDSVMQLDVLKLGFADNSLDVDFSSLNFAANSTIQYKMEGIDNDWHTADKDNKTNFPFLPPGKYTLLLRTMNAEGTASQITSLKIFIGSPFYQTWWFYTLIAVLSAATLFWLDRQRMKRKEALQRVRTDIAGGLHQEVNTALNNINILSEIARLKSEREPAKARDYLEQIHTKSHNMIIALDDMLWSLDPENDAMDKTIQRIREFADALMQRSGAMIELLIDKKVEKLQLNMKLRHEAFLLFKEGLRSLIDAGTRHCIVHLTAERGKLFFTIEFANDDCNMQKLNNLLQRRDLEERLHDLKAKLDVQVHKSRSIFMLHLPLH
jgi:ligand-binding sensor domain-containing protein/signal transduction histidine kinase